MQPAEVRLFERCVNKLPGRTISPLLVLESLFSGMAVAQNSASVGDNVQEASHNVKIKG